MLFSTTLTEDCGDLPIVGCSYRPCAQLYCKDNLNATCRENFCGGCNAVFYIVINAFRIYVFIQNEPPEVFYNKRCSKKFCKIHRKTPVMVSLVVFFSQIFYFLSYRGIFFVFWRCLRNYEFLLASAYWFLSKNTAIITRRPINLIRLRYGNFPCNIWIFSLCHCSPAYLSKK